MDRFRGYIDNLLIGVVGGVLGWLLGRWFIPPWGQLIGALIGVLAGLIISEKITNAFVKAKSRFRRWLLEGLEVKSDLDKALADLNQKADDVARILEEAKKETDSETQVLSRVKIETLNVLQGCIRAYYLDGKHENVIELCDSLQQIDKESYEAYYYRGRSKVATGHDKLALPDLLEASSIRKNDPDVHNSLAGVYINLEQFQSAVDESELALKLGFKEPLAGHGTIARAREEMRQFPEALAERDICLSISSRHAPSIEAKIRILAELAAQGLRSWDEVFRFADECIDLQPKNASYYIYKALACLRRNTQGDWVTSMGLFSQAEAANPRDNRIYQYKGNVLLQAAKKARDQIKREEILREVSETARKGIFHTNTKWFRPVFYELQRKALVLSGKLDEALTVAMKGPVDNPENAWNQLKVAISFLALERYKEAVVSCEEALESCDFLKTPLARLWILYVLCMAKALQLPPREEVSQPLCALLGELDNYDLFKADRWPDWDELSDLTNKLVVKTQNPLANDLFLLIRGELNKDVFKKSWSL